MDGPVTPQTICLSYGETAAVVDAAAGGRVSSLVIDGRELLVQHASDIFHWGSFPMAPWAGRVRGGRFEFGGTVVRLPINAPPNSLHGLVTDRIWTVVAMDTQSVSLSVDLGQDRADPWPWPCQVRQHISLSQNRMDFQLAVIADQTMPADIGWHPWFVRDLPTGAGHAACELEVSSGQIYLNDAEGLPSGELGPPPPPPWDYCFVGLEQPPRLRWPGVLELTVNSECDHWVLYDKEPAGICVEPWTGPPNSLNGPERRIVTADQPLEATMTWMWRRLEP